MPAAGDVVYLTYTQQDQQSGLLLRLAAVMQGLKQSVAELQLHRQQPSRRLQAAASGAAQAPMAAPGPGLGAGPASSADQQPSRGAGPADGPALGPVPPQQALVSWLPLQPHGKSAVALPRQLVACRTVYRSLGLDGRAAASMNAIMLCLRARDTIR